MLFTVYRELMPLRLITKVLTNYPQQDDVGPITLFAYSQLPVISMEPGGTFRNKQQPALMFSDRKIPLVINRLCKQPLGGVSEWNTTQANILLTQRIMYMRLYKHLAVHSRLYQLSSAEQSPWFPLFSPITHKAASLTHVFLCFFLLARNIEWSAW